MLSRLGSAAAWRRFLITAVLCAGIAACGGEAEPEGELVPADADAVAAVEEPQVGEPALRRFLPDQMQRSTRAESFPHDAHGDIDCAVCHESPRGHTSHGDLTCGDCHRAAQSTVVQALTPDQCQSCHHDAEQALACESCHASRPSLTSVQELALEVWSAPRTRALEFDHAVHGAQACSSCHQALPALSPAEPCASCHVDHHAEGVTCAACHEAAPESAHDVEVHLTCSGAGCHRAPEVEAIASSRTVCLSCHLDQLEHEPGGDCVECHQLGGEITALATWRHP